MSDPRDEGTVSSERADQILRRASELEAQGVGDVEVGELRKVALEAGIPLGAFERALAEARSPVPTTDELHVPDKPSGPMGWLRRALLGATGLGIAAGAAALSRLFLVNADAAAMFSVVVVGLVALALALVRRRDRSVTDFLLDLAPLWVGFTLAWMLIDPVDAAAVLAGTSLIGTIAAVVGSLIVRLGSPDSERDRLSEDPEPYLLTN